ncbi:MAG: hypothetical protein R6U70_02185 [Bacillota bacterium]
MTYPSPSEGARGPVVAVVGACASGKTTLVERLRERGIRAHSLAQEHSAAPSLYLRGVPDYVVYLDVSYDEVRRRRDVSWGPARLQAQKLRLRRSMENADLRILTDELDPAEICEMVVQYLAGRGEVIIGSDTGQSERGRGDHRLPGEGRLPPG